MYFAPKNVQFKDNYPEPTIKSGTDVKLKVHYCGICGSDLHEYQSGPTFFAKEGQNHAISNKAYPHVMGHEMSAEIVDLKIRPLLARRSVQLVRMAITTCASIWDSQDWDFLTEDSLSMW